MKTFPKMLSVLLAAWLALALCAAPALATNADGVQLKTRPAQTEAPTPMPTEAPTAAPTEAPTAAPTEVPAAATDPAPTEAPAQGSSGGGFTIIRPGNAQGDGSGEGQAAEATPEVTEAPAAGTGSMLPTAGAEDALQSNTGNGQTVTVTAEPAPTEQQAPAQPAEESSADAWYVGGIGTETIDYVSRKQPMLGKKNDRYFASLYACTSPMNPGTALVAGVLYAPAGMVPDDAQVAAAGFQPVRPERIFRFAVDPSGEPQEAGQLAEAPDRSLPGFAFLVNLQEAAAGGSASLPVTVRLAFGGYRIEIENYTLMLDGGCSAFGDIVHALHGVCILPDEKMQQVGWVQEKLILKEFLTADQKSGVYDEATRNALKEMCGLNSGLEYSEDGILPKTLSQLLSINEANADSYTGRNDGVLSIMKREIKLMNFSIPLWMLVAAGAALLLIILAVILIIAGHRRKKRRALSNLGGGLSDETPPLSGLQGTQMEEEEQGTLLPEEEDGGDILEDSSRADGPAAEGSGMGGIALIGDEPTVGLEDTVIKPQIQFSDDDKTVDMAFRMQVRMFYDGQYMNTETDLAEGVQKILGRGEDAALQTNPADNSVSHRHGYFSVQNGSIVYTDTSRNGTRINGQRTLRNGESNRIPFNQKVQLEVGSHKLWVFVAH